MGKIICFCVAIISLLPVAASARHRYVAPPLPMLAVAPYQRVPIAELERVPLGSEIEVVGYFSRKSPEIDGDLEVYLIDHHGQFVVIEAPRHFRDMKFYIRSLHLHRGELVVTRGILTQQRDKPTKYYINGWFEIQPVEAIARYTGPMPADLHYVKVVHRMFGRAHITQI